MLRLRADKQLQAIADSVLIRFRKLIRGTDTYSRIRLPELRPLVAPAIVAQA